MTLPTVEPQTDDHLSIVTLLDKTLELLVEAYRRAGVELPERRYWTLGTASADCEQVVIVFLQAYIGPPGDEAATPQRCDGPRSAVMSVQVHRCIPTVGQRGKAPTGGAIQSGAVPLAIDAWVLLDSARDLDTWAEFPGTFGAGVIATVEAGQPQGGFQSMNMQLTVQIP